jgi:hypothetical protein
MREWVLWRLTLTASEEIKTFLRAAARLIQPAENTRGKPTEEKKDSIEERGG